jgi:hypothetical protein
MNRLYREVCNEETFEKIMDRARYNPSVLFIVNELKHHDINTLWNEWKWDDDETNKFRLMNFFRLFPKFLKAIGKLTINHDYSMAIFYYFKKDVEFYKKRNRIH